MAKKPAAQKIPHKVAVSTGAGARQFRDAASDYADKTTRSRQAAKAALRRIGIITDTGKLTARYKSA